MLEQGVSIKLRQDEEELRYQAENHHYPAIMKQQAAELYLFGQVSIEEVCKKYQLRSRTQLEQ